MKTPAQLIAQFGYIFATILTIVGLCLPLLTFYIPAGANFAGYETQEVIESTQKGITLIAFWPALVCSIIGSISILVKYRRIFVFVVGLISSVNLLAAFIYTQNAESGLLLSQQYSSTLNFLDVVEMRIEVGAYVCLIAAVLMVIFSFMNFIFVKND